MPSTAKLSFALLGFISAVTAARYFSFLQKLCSVGCFKKPTVMGLVPHHFYYGVGIVALSVIPLLSARRPAVKWDASLFFGAGAGLISDELGQFLRIAPYWSLTSILFPVTIGGALLIVTVGLLVRRKGIREFGLMKRVDIGTTMSLVMFMFGFLYFEKSLGMFVQIIGLGSWASSLVLMLVFGKKHFTMRI